jgi:dTDP-4-dehydrorhamnose 3,5-epimerase
MRCTPLALRGAMLIEPAVYPDLRGAFFEAWNERAFAAAGVDARFVQDNVSISSRYVLRGLHYQLSQVQGKLIHVLAGEIFDVIVDLRRSSPSFGQSVSVTLSAELPRSLWVPPGLAHGFLALADNTRVQYKVTDFWAKQAERTLAWNDPALGICWPLPPNVAPSLSDKDHHGQTLAQAETFP